jgi:formyl-CoA transferase
MPELKEDSRFAIRKDRVANEALLIPILSAKIAERTASELSEALVARGVIASPIYRASDMVKDPQVVHRNLHFTVPHPKFGEAPIFASPLRMSKTPVDQYKAPPMLGEHTDEVLRDVLGYSPERISALRQAKAI